MDIVGWASKVAMEDLALLKDAEFADDHYIWIVQGCKEGGFLIRKEDDERVIFKHFDFFRSGSFYVNEADGVVISQLIMDALSDLEKSTLQAKTNLANRGFLVSALGGDSGIVLLNHTIESFECSKDLPDDGQWIKIEECIFSSNVSNMKCMIQYVEKWIEYSESMHGGKYDVFKRILLAVLHRRTGQIQKAIEASEVVKLPNKDSFGSESSRAVLCTTYAASLMDLFETSATSTQSMLAEARVLLNRANAISGDNTEHVMKAYQRLKSLELRRE